MYFAVEKKIKNIKIKLKKICTDATCSVVVVSGNKCIKIRVANITQSTQMEGNSYISEGPSKIICSEHCKVTEDNLG